MPNNRKDMIENWINGMDKKKLEIIMINTKGKYRGNKAIIEKIIGEPGDNQT